MLQSSFFESSKTARSNSCLTTSFFESNFSSLNNFLKMITFMSRFFCSYIVEQSRSRSVRHGKTLGKITQGSADLPVRATGVQYPIIAPQTQRLCGFAGFSIQEIMMSKDIFPDSLSYMICSTTLLIRFPFSS